MSFRYDIVIQSYTHPKGGVFIIMYGRSRLARPSQLNNAGTEHVGFSPTMKVSSTSKIEHPPQTPNDDAHKH